MTDAVQAIYGVLTYVLKNNLHNLFTFLSLSLFANVLIEIKVNKTIQLKKILVYTRYS